MRGVLGPFGGGDWWPFCWTRTRGPQGRKSEGTGSSDQVRTHFCSSAVLGSGLVPSISKGSLVPALPLKWLLPSVLAARFRIAAGRLRSVPVVICAE